MSIENVAAFYLKLEKDPLLRAKAMDLKNHYPAHTYRILYKNLLLQI